MSSTFVTKVGLFQRCFTKLKVIVKSDEILLYNLLEYSGLAGGLLPPIGYEVDSSLAYAGRQSTCYISHTDGDNAPAS